MLVMIALVEQHEAGFGYPGVQRAHPPRHHPRSPAQVAPHLRGDHRTDQGHLGRAQKHGCNRVGEKAAMQLGLIE